MNSLGIFSAASFQTKKRMLLEQDWTAKPGPRTDGLIDFPPKSDGNVACVCGSKKERTEYGCLSFSLVLGSHSLVLGATSSFWSGFHAQA